MEGLYWEDYFYTDDLYLVGIAAAIVIFLAFKVLFPERRSTENRMFFSLCVMDLCLAASFALKASLFYVLTDYNLLSNILVIFFNPAVDIISLMIVVQWLLFVEYFLHQSRDLIPRRYRWVLIPFSSP